MRHRWSDKNVWNDGIFSSLSWAFSNVFFFFFFTCNQFYAIICLKTVVMRCTFAEIKKKMLSAFAHKLLWLHQSIFINPFTFLISKFVAFSTVFSQAPRPNFWFKDGKYNNDQRSNNNIRLLFSAKIYSSVRTYTHWAANIIAAMMTVWVVIEHAFVCRRHIIVNKQINLWPFHIIFLRCLLSNFFQKQTKKKKYSVYTTHL